MDVAADADERGEFMRITKSRFQSHQAALGEAQDDGLFAWESRAQRIEKFCKKRATALDAGSGVAGEIVPRETCVVRVGRVDEQVIHPRNLQPMRDVAVALHTVA